MTTLQERIEASTTQLETDSDLMHDVVHGGTSTTVVTEGGTVKSLAKSIADMEAAYAANSVIATGQGHLDDAYNWANRAEDSEYTDGDARTGYSAFHYAEKSSAFAAAAAASAAIFPLNKTDATVDPTVNDDSADGYIVGSTWFNIVSKEVFKCIDNSLGAADWVLTTLTLDDLGALAAQDSVTIALMANAAKPYDIGFVAGYGIDGTEEDVDVQQYGAVILTRDVIFEDIEAYALTAPVGSAMQFDIKKNGVTIFSTAPEIDDGSNADDGNHVISVTSGAAGDRITFEITQVGSTTSGSGVMLSIKGRIN